jgi:predicted GNAT family acetyltransferase
MEVVRLEDASCFLAEAESLLLADEARHNLILGIAGNARDGVYDDYRLWLVRDGSEVVGAALQTPPYNLILARPQSSEALATLVKALTNEVLPGVVGAEPEVTDFAELWSAHTRDATRIHMRQGIYALQQVEPPGAVSGSARVATVDDRELVLQWLIAFLEEAGSAAERRTTRDRAEATLDHRLSSSTAGNLLWEDENEPVALAGWTGPTPNGIRVGPVYTPPELRGRGYATALTAELSRQLLDGRLFEGGRRFCFLYTDLANPTSNAIYERIGYVRVAESAEIVFG